MESNTFFPCGNASSLTLHTDIKVTFLSMLHFVGPFELVCVRIRILAFTVLEVLQHVLVSIFLPQGTCMSMQIVSWTACQRFRSNKIRTPWSDRHITEFSRKCFSQSNALEAALFPEPRGASTRVVSPVAVLLRSISCFSPKLQLHKSSWVRMSTVPGRDSGTSKALAIQSVRQSRNHNCGTATGFCLDRWSLERMSLCSTTGFLKNTIVSYNQVWTLKAAPQLAKIGLLQHCW